MKYLRIFRTPNLLIMAATLMLVRYGLFLPLYMREGLEVQMPGWAFILLVLSTLMIAAAGYIINDLLDKRMDELNKPGKNITDIILGEEKATYLNYILNISGIILGIIISIFAHKIQMSILFLLIATALYYYSLKYKYLPLWGNLVVALLSSMVIIICWLYEFFFLRANPENFIQAAPLFKTVNFLVFGYAFFAFLTSLTREMIKDIQDVPGDTKSGCRTIPVVLGIERARMIIMGTVVLNMLALAFFQVLLFNSGYIVTAAYLVIIQVLFAFSGFMLAKARQYSDFGPISLLFKIIMLAGIASMALTWFINTI